MSSAITKIAAATAVTLVAGLGLTFSAGSASADDEFGFCESENTPAPENTDPANQAPVANDDTASTAAGLKLALKVLANDSDPDSDKLYVTSATDPKRGEICLEKNGTITYMAAMRRVDYTDTFTYGVTDGDRYRTAKVTVKVTGIRAMRADLRHKLVLKRGGHKVKQPARIAFRNPNNRRMLLIGGDPNKEKPSFQRYVQPKSTTVVVSKRKRLTYVVVLAPRTDDFALVNVGLLNTKNGRHQMMYVGDEDNWFRSSGSSSSSRSSEMARSWAHRIR